MGFQRIIVGFNDGERDALKLAAVLQRASGAELLVAHRQDADPRDVLADAQTELPYGTAVRLHVVYARSLAHGLSELAQRVKADLIVVGTSLGTRLLQAAPCAVAVAPPGFADDPDPGLRVIGIAYDGGRESQSAVAAAADLAVAAGATVRLIGVVEPAATHGAGLVAMSGWAEPGGITRDRMRHGLEVLADDLPEELRTATVVADGDPAREILKHTGILSLLVMGSRGYGPLRRVLLGSVSGAVVGAALCPVLVLPRSASAGWPLAAPGSARERFNSRVQSTR